MTYFVFFYNIGITFMSLVAFYVYLALFRTEKLPVYHYTAILFGLYTLDILVLFMIDFIPDFYSIFRTFQQATPYIYSSLSLGMLVCYRLILGEFFGRTFVHNEVAFWIACLTGVIVSWTLPDPFAYHVVEALFSTSLHLWIIAFSLWHLSKPIGILSQRGRCWILFLVLVFALCEFADTMFSLQGSAVLPSTFRRLPMEILGLTVIASAFLYLFLRRQAKHTQVRNGLISAISQQYELTRREAEILAMLAEGLSNREISDKDYVSVSTTKTHVHHIYEKLGISGRVELSGFLERELRQAQQSLR